MLCQIHVKHVQNINAFILRVKDPVVLVPLKERGCSCILCLLQKRHDWRFSVGVGPKRSWEGTHITGSC